MLECPLCEKDDRCQERNRHARRIWLALVHESAQPECLDFEDKKPYWRALEWRRRG